MTLVSSPGDATRTHDWCAWRHRVMTILPVQAGVIIPINNNTYSLYIDMKLYTHKSTILKPTHTNPRFIFGNSPEPGRYCDIEDKNLKFNISYFLYCR